MFGRGSRLYRLAMRKIWLVQAHPAALMHLKEQPGQTTALDLRLLRAWSAPTGSCPGFWLQSFPVLALPHGAVGPLRRLAQGSKARLAARR